jgi:nudix-type nucleoside diphosphatase (YffH/AdpP family)
VKSRKYQIKKTETLHEGWGKLQAVTYDAEGQDGAMSEHSGELYDIGNAATVLLYDAARGTVLLNRQFRIATVFNGHPDGMLTEACAGKIEDGLSAEETALKELREETGYVVGEVTPVMRLFMSPGSFTEQLHFFTAPYTPADKKEAGGGKKEEGEAIDLMEMRFEDAMEMLRRGEIIDAKTVILLQHAALSGLLSG